MKDLYVHETSVAVNCSGGVNAKVYKCCDVKNSFIGDSSTIGDYSRLGDCHIDCNVRIQRNAMMYGVEMGRYSYTGKNFTAWNCQIGAFCSISWNVSIGGANHDYSRTTTHSFLYSRDFGLIPDEACEENIGYDRFSEPCIIENDVWIAANACICRGVTVHTGAVIAAGAVVTHDVEPYTIVAGVPAKPLKKRFDDKTIELLLESRWWDFPSDVIKNNYGLFNAKTDVHVAQQLLRIRQRIDRGEK